MNAGSYREKRPGVFEFRLRVGTDPVTGKPVRLSHTWRGTKRNAARALATWVAEVDAQRPATVATVAWLLDTYLDHLAKEGRSASTLRTYRSYVDIWIRPALADKSINELTAGDIRGLMATMTSQKRSASTCRQVHAILRGAIKFAMQHDWVDRNVATLATPPKLSRTPVVAATPDEAALLYRHSGTPGDDLPTAIALATYTGARLGELCSLRWSDIDEHEIQIYGFKTHSVRTIPILDSLRPILEERRQFQIMRAERVGVELCVDPYLLSFWANGENAPDVSSYTHKFAILRDSLRLPHLHLHTLRHCFATEALAAGVDPLTVAKLLGHADLAMIGRVYGHGTPGATKRAAATINEALQIRS